MKKLLNSYVLAKTGMSNCLWSEVYQGEETLPIRSFLSKILLQARSGLAGPKTDWIF